MSIENILFTHERLELTRFSFVIKNEFVIPEASCKYHWELREELSI